MDPDINSRPTRRRLVPVWAWVAGGVVALAAVILVVAAFSAPKRTEPPAAAKIAAGVVTELDPLAEADKLAQQARDALASGDASSALDLAAQALDLDPDNEDAKRVQSEATDSSSDGSTTTTDLPPADEDVFLEEHPIRSLLPAVVTGYSFGTTVSDERNAEVSAEPMAGSPALGRIVRVQMATHDLKTKAAAGEYIANVTKKVYAADVSSADIAGATAYVATDDIRLAAVVFVRGRYAFEVIATADNVDPAQIRALAVEVAKSFPTSP